MKKRFAPRTAIVTGGGRGIGAAAARLLTAAGLQVTVCARGHEGIEALVRDGGAALAVRANVAREADVANLVAEHERRLGPCDLLVNNAGLLVRGLAEALAPADFRAVLDVNLTGAFLCARAVLPGMKARRRGRVVNVTSISASMGSAEGSAYNASKWGLLGLTKCLAEELRPFGVQALAVSPGSTDTAMLAQTPFPPEMSAEEVARVIAWCGVEAPDAMTGSSVEVHG